MIKPKNKPSRADALSHATNELMHVSQILKLCAFASEARRTLDDIDKFKLIFPDRGQEIDRHVEAGSEWREHDDAVGLVLKNISIQVDNLIEVMGGA